MSRAYLVVSALTLAAVAAGCGLDAPVVSMRPAPAPAPAPASSPPAAPAAPTPAAAGGKVLGPNGYGALTLGVPRADAVRTGLLTPANPVATNPAECTLHHIAGRPAAERIGVYVSPRQGVVQIASAPDWRTPENIGAGSTLTQVRAAYPDLVQDVNGTTATVPGNPTAVYRFMLDPQGTVVEFSLELRGQECTN
ncbi:hypothetical protein [Pseudonocardia acaciae]|uniref:hypothetical protein n=1 Tax=Pseudonocardia acaciae TaxID=551276 RepID=UPI000688F435|nr:hypothetical protein [Pseudonocardia acaciae]